MNEEIKCLLNEIKDSSQDYVGTNGCKYQDLLREELDLLLNYITNLQEDIESRKKEIDYWRIQFSNLQEENKKLVKVIDELLNYLIKNLKKKKYDNDFERYTAYEDILNKLTELKGGSDE